MTRRDLALICTASLFGLKTLGLSAQSQSATMYGLIGQIEAVPGQRDALARILLAGVSGLPGCMSYVVALDAEDPDSIWVTEVWDSQQSHAASLSLESVQDAIEQGRPMIAGFTSQVTTQPLGGYGLA